MHDRRQFADLVLRFRTDAICGLVVESPVTVSLLAIHYFLAMAANPDNVIAFPLHLRHEMRGCPHCGQRDDVWQIGRLLWAYCETHEVRWVVADYNGVTRATINRRELKKGLEFLSTFAEVSR